MGCSVVMPTLNQASFISAAIDSVFAGGVGISELIVADGGSVDETQARVAHLARVHGDRLRCQSARDAGSADAVNKAIALASSDVVGWLNSDDLYAPGAIDRALAHFAAHPDHVAVYGHGEHIDVEGRLLGRYPTRGPEWPLSGWADGCPICQPTMFLRREAVEAILPLDISLRAAFDYDLWFKLFTRFPGRIGFIDEVQAYSRLHDQGITLSQRRTVALEGLKVVHRYLGRAPGHWLLTYAEELRRQLPDGEDPPLRARLAGALSEAATWLGTHEVQRVARQWQADRAVLLASRHCVVDAYPDGWLPVSCAIRLRADRPSTLVLRGRHEGAQPAVLHLEAVSEDGQVQAIDVRRRGAFAWGLKVPALPGVTQHWQLRCSPGFVPARTAAGSTDTRELGWLLDSATLSA